MNAAGVQSPRSVRGAPHHLGLRHVGPGAVVAVHRHQGATVILRLPPILHFDGCRSIPHISNSL